MKTITENIDDFCQKIEELMKFKIYVENDEEEKNMFLGHQHDYYISLLLSIFYDNVHSDKYVVLMSNLTRNIKYFFVKCSLVCYLFRKRFHFKNILISQRIFQFFKRRFPHDTFFPKER